MTNHGTTYDTTNDTTYDIVLFGATGFVGALTAEYLAGHAPQDLRIALAGRNRAKLEDTRRNLAASHPRAERFGLVIADSSDAESLRALAGSARVVISTVGPYFRYGLPLVEACAKAGTHYVDLSGEVLFMRESIRLYHDAAKNSGARIVHACGFDSVPSDMGMLLLHQLAQQVGEPLESATMIVRMKGGVSGGTVDSMREQFKVTKADKELARAVARPYTLSPDPESEPDVGKQEDFGIIRTDSVGGRADGWAGPFVMAGANTRVVRRSNALLSHAYGPQLTYSEYMATGTGLKGRARSYALAGGLGVAMVALNAPKLRGVLSRWVPEPGEGPSVEDRDNGFFSTTHYGTTAGGTMLSATMSLDADPGYKGTSLMLGEAALTLAVDTEDLPHECAADHQGPTGGGVLTPATGLGLAYARRLAEAGMRMSPLPWQ
ncbi:saccharopine dehydrogenase family protein [Corynebacterium falsenii]|uniref:saccharopine dehydrogenase family protein n=1 Tax=Corynebacterium falsenii TaxID=108486 RepID=UPI003FD697D2